MTEDCDLTGLSRTWAGGMRDAVWLTRREAASRARVSESSITRAVSKGEIRHARIFVRRGLRFLPDWIDEWVARRHTPVGINCIQAGRQRVTP